MTIREQIVKEALSWVPTPYVDHQGMKHAGVDCAFFPTMVYQAIGLIPRDFVPPKYSPQAWLNSPSQTDKLHLKFEDRTMLDLVLKYSDHEVPEGGIVRPGDLMLVLVAASWTHGGIVIEWPNRVLHPVKELGVIGSHGLKEGFWMKRRKRFFSFVKETA